MRKNVLKFVSIIQRLNNVGRNWTITGNEWKRRTSTIRHDVLLLSDFYIEYSIDVHLSNNKYVESKKTNSEINLFKKLLRVVFSFKSQHKFWFTIQYCNVINKE